MSSGDPVPVETILFDGECNLCNGSVRFFMKHDPRGRFRFVPAQSEEGRTLAAKFGFTGPTPGSMVLISGDHCYTKSTCGLQIARRLSWPWPLLYVFVLVPRPLRDAVYMIIAKNRRRWFGTATECAVTPAARQAKDAE
ncbi:MAG: DUF393 domain-containing protein [Tepidisphaeraceae bacterium]|jgi:predicted DCC family thiol-disulfide oxidoreductase YuxK